MKHNKLQLRTELILCIITYIKINKISGISCTFARCKNVNKRARKARNRISFFRFPKDIERNVKGYANYFPGVISSSGLWYYLIKIYQTYRIILV